MGAAREREGRDTWAKVQNEDGLVGDCEGLVHLQMKYTWKGENEDRMV